jgi:hypothetical protein
MQSVVAKSVADIGHFHEQILCFEHILDTADRLVDTENSWDGIHRTDVNVRLFHD